MKLRLYLDTSIFSLNFDERSPERKLMTEQVFIRREEFELATSIVTREELLGTADSARREQMISLLNTVRVHPISDEIKNLAEKYRHEGIFTPAMLDDSLHVAAA